MSSKKNIGKSRPRKTIRNVKISPKNTQIVRTLMEMLNVVKLYHWHTHSHPEHKATDELYERLNEHIDKFVEVMLGKKGTRIQKWDKHMVIKQYDSKTSFQDRMYEYRDFLVDMNRHLNVRKDSDLLNIRDEILGDVNQFLYLMTFH